MLQLLQETYCYLEKHSSCPICINHLSYGDVKRLKYLQIKLASSILEELGKISSLQNVWNVAELQLENIPHIKEEPLPEDAVEKVPFPFNQNLSDIYNSSHDDQSSELLNAGAVKCKTTEVECQTTVNEGVLLIRSRSVHIGEINDKIEDSEEVHDDDDGYDYIDSDSDEDYIPPSPIKYAAGKNNNLGEYIIHVLNNNKSEHIALDKSKDFSVEDDMPNYNDPVAMNSIPDEQQLVEDNSNNIVFDDELNPVTNNKPQDHIIEDFVPGKTKNVSRANHPSADNKLLRKSKRLSKFSFPAPDVNEAVDKNPEDSVDEEDLLENEVTVKQNLSPEEAALAEIFRKLQKKKRKFQRERENVKEKVVKVQVLDEEKDWMPSGEEEETEETFKLFDCKFCSRKFDSERGLVVHRHVHLGEKRYKCRQCSEKFESEIFFKEHVKTHADETLSQNSAHPRKEHDLIQNPASETCEVFGENEVSVHSTTEVVPVQKHEEVEDLESEENIDEPFKCTLCCKRFAKEDACEIHMKRVHLGEDPFKCGICEESFTFKKVLEKHFKSEHPLQKRPRCFICSNCDKGFVSQRFLKAHLSSGVCEKVSCEVCGKQMLKSSLDHHMLIHGDKLPFSCDVCAKSFLRKSSVKYHVCIVHNTHNKELYICETCGAEYKTKQGLRSHSYTHTGNLPFTCDICGKGFPLQGKLNYHINVTHASEKPFSCDLCHKRFKVIGHLKRHAILHTGNKKIHCDICGRKFYRNANMLKHRKIHTKSQPSSQESTEYT